MPNVPKALLCSALSSFLRTAKDLASSLVLLSILKDQAVPDDGENEPLIPRGLGEGVAAGLKDLAKGLGAGGEDSGGGAEEGVADQVGGWPFADPGDVGLGRVAGQELVEGLAEEGVVVLRWE